MGKLFHLSVVTPDRTVYEADVSSVRLPTTFGSLGVMAGHAPMLCALGEGSLRCTDESGQSLRIDVTGGIARVDRNEMTVLTPTAELV